MRRCQSAIIVAALGLSLTGLFGCSPALPAAEPRPASTAAATAATTADKGLLWTLHAAEYRATTTTLFRAAAGALPELLSDASWTAALEQDSKAAQGKPPAVVVDVDDTLLNTSSYQWQLAKQGQAYDQASWDAWAKRGEAWAIAGAVEYVERLAALKVAVFYVTNRSCQARASNSADACPQASETQRNLVRAGFSPPQPGHLLLRGMRPEWGADKSSRRAYVAASYRIVQLVGDDLGDFVAGARDANQKQRSQLVAEHRTLWGRAWFMLPNPMYGSWQAHLPTP